MTRIAPPVFLPTSKHLSKTSENYIVALDGFEPEPARDNIQALVRFHHLKLDPVTGKPMLPELVEILYTHLAEFCLKASKIAAAKTNPDHIALLLEAKSLLRRHERGGEAGELLAYFLIEAILGAPQLVAKMDLKTNTSFESLGADGLHFKWNEEKLTLEIYSAESKLEEKASSAVRNLVTSLENFHTTEQYRTELRLATAHFKHAEPKMQQTVMRILQNKEPGVRYCLRHACLVGYNWKGYSGLDGNDIETQERNFKELYLKQRDRLHTLISTHFPRAVKAAGALVAFDVFFLPFLSVQEFRSTFNNLVK